MESKLTIYDPSALEFINESFEFTVLDSDCQFTEGPVWHPEGYYLFSDITANCIYRITEAGEKSVWMLNSGTSYALDPDLKPDQAGSNGLAYTPEGILICQHGDHSISRYEGGNTAPIVSRYQGKPFNSPNDLIVHSNGDIFFSDPPYGLKDGVLNKNKFQPFAGVYRFRNGVIELVTTAFDYPNGICLSPDESTLYVCSHKPHEKKILAFDAENFDLKGCIAEENSDGLEMDKQGNFYLYNAEGLIVLNPDGQRLAAITLPAHPANGCWGGKHGRNMLVTARAHVFLLKGLLRHD